MKYYVQNFDYEGPGNSRCCGAEQAHDHDAANNFTKDVKAWLTGQGAKKVTHGPFLSGQPRPADAKEFRWNGSKKKWEKS